jgi:arylsulfatase
MKAKTVAPALLALYDAVMLTAAPVLAGEKITGVLGSPGATTTISGKQLPPPDPEFGGVIKEKASESKAW